MKKIVLFGDSLFLGPEAIFNLLSARIISQRPSASLSVSAFSSAGLMCRDAIAKIPFHIIGQSPQVVFLGLGNDDLAAGTDVGNFKKSLSESIGLILDKTGALIVIANLCSAFYCSESERHQKCSALNAVIFETTAQSGVTLADLDTAAHTFLDQHRQSKGQKFGLHTEGPRLTTLGSVILSDCASKAIVHAAD